MDNHTPEQRRKNMKAVKNKDSEIERLLRKELWSRGLRYRKNYKKIIGKPDIVFVGKKIADKIDGVLDEISGSLTEDERSAFYRSLSVISNSLDTVSQNSRRE